jgi:putative transcriptional regulator
MDFFASDTVIEPRAGDLLISEPYLPDPNFERTVILLCAHDENGSMGFVLNRPGNMQVADVLDDIERRDLEVFMGGPVQQDTLHFIHRLPELSREGNEVMSGLYWGGDFSKMVTMANTFQVQPTDARFFIGYSGWSEGQLMRELEERSWIVFRKATADLVLNTPVEELWKEVLNRMGGKFRVISKYPKDPRLN